MFASDVFSITSYPGGHSPGFPWMRIVHPALTGCLWKVPWCCGPASPARPSATDLWAFPPPFILSFRTGPRTETSFQEWVSFAFSVFRFGNKKCIKSTEKRST